jgi:hypothetical protein
MPLWAQVAAAFVGSLLAMLYVLLFANRVKSMSMLLVVGIMISYICSAITDLCITFANDSDIANLTHWAMGSFSGSSWSTVKLAAAVVFPTAVVTFLFSKPISAYLLGEGYAQSMGIHIRFFRVCIILLSSLLSACVTALAGPISFVGIAVPHITRLSLKTTKPVVTIPAIFLCGAVFCMFCDLIARTGNRNGYGSVWRTGRYLADGEAAEVKGEKHGTGIYRNTGFKCGLSWKGTVKRHCTQGQKRRNSCTDWTKRCGKVHNFKKYYPGNAADIRRYLY